MSSEVRASSEDSKYYYGPHSFSKTWAHTHTQLYIVFTRWAKVYMEREVFPLQQLCVSLIYISSNTKLAAVKELRVREAGRGERGEKETSLRKGWRECEKEIRGQKESWGESGSERDRDGRDQHIILFLWSLATTVPPSAPSLWFLIIRCSSLHASFLLPSCCSCLYTHLSPCLLMFLSHFAYI